jgi:fructose-specific PTS system IIB-like component
LHYLSGKQVEFLTAIIPARKTVWRTLMTKKKLIALCACPMGLAHTFMAAQALEDAATEAGYEVKIETQGADGIQNRLTAQDIAQADIIIHAIAITPEDNERFESRDVYEITLQDAIKNAAGTIREIEEMIAAEQQ